MGQIDTKSINCLTLMGQIDKIHMEKLRIIPSTNDRYSVDKDGNVFDNIRKKRVEEYSNSGSVKIVFESGRRSVSQKRLVDMCWSAEEQFTPTTITDKITQIILQVEYLNRELNELRDLVSEGKVG